LSLKNKKVLITAGPTWVSIDNVRVISNIATGKTGILLADRLHRLGAKVTLMLGPVEACCLRPGIRLIRFRFFDQLKDSLKKELRERYDIVIHSAAVSDYRPAVARAKKFGSGLKNWILHLKPTPKIINEIKKVDPGIFLIGFKYEPGLAKNGLISESKILMRETDADLVVANTQGINRYSAYIVSKTKTGPGISSKERLVKSLINEMDSALCRKQP
jgi:phosphopantothenoylcysteine decarboxylase / phosphopantothenate---cysteine ligase